MQPRSPSGPVTGTGRSPSSGVAHRASSSGRIGSVSSAVRSDAAAGGRSGRRASRRDRAPRDEIDAPAVLISAPVARADRAFARGALDDAALGTGRAAVMTAEYAPATTSWPPVHRSWPAMPRRPLPTSPGSTRLACTARRSTLAELRFVPGLPPSTVDPPTRSLSTATLSTLPRPWIAGRRGVHDDRDGDAPRPGRAGRSAAPRTLPARSSPDSVPRRSWRGWTRP